MSVAPRGAIAEERQTMHVTDRSNLAFQFERDDRRTSFERLFRQDLAGSLRRLSLLILVATNGLASGEDRITIEIGTTSIPSFAESWFLGEIASFMKEHSNIEVETVAITDPYRPFRAQLEELPRLAKNVVGIQTGFDDELNYLASRELLVPIERFLPDIEFESDQFPDNSWEDVSYEGKTYGVVWSMDILYLILDTSLLGQEGMSQPPRTWDELRQYAKQLTKDIDGDGRIEQFGLYVPPSIGVEELLWSSLDLQKDVTYYQDGRLNFDQPAIRQSLEFVRELLQSDFVDRSFKPSFGQDGDPRAVMMIMSNFAQHLPQVVSAARKFSQGNRFKVAPIPTLSREVFAAGRRTYLAVRKSVPAQEEASWKLVKWLTRRDVSPPEFWFGFPTRMDFWERPDIQARLSNQCQDMKLVPDLLLQSRRVGFSIRGEAVLGFVGDCSQYWNGRMSTDNLVTSLNARSGQIFIGQ